MPREFFVKNENETRKLAKILAACLAEVPIKSGRRRKETLVIGLEGELGSGKTTFIKAFARGLRIRRRLTSPTFVLMKKYRLPKGKIPNSQFPIPNYLYLFHVDCYRIRSFKDILVLDFQEIISNPKNIVIIEWAEKMRKILPEDTIWIKFKIISNKERKITIS